MCLLGVSLTLLPILGVKSPENPNFWCVNRRFKAKRAKYWKFHVIETTASISTKFLHNDRDHQVVVVGGPNRRPTNPRWRTAAILKTVKSPYLCNRLTDFVEIWHGDAHWPPTAVRPLKFWISENSRWRQPPSWKSQKTRYLRSGLTDLYEIWFADAKWVS